MARALNKPCLIFKEKDVELKGISKSITTIGEFDRRFLDKKLTEFISSIKDEASKLNKGRIIKIEGWEDTKCFIEEILEKAEKYIYGIVEDFSSVDKFKNTLDYIKKDVEVKIISSADKKISKLVNVIENLNCIKKELRFIHQSKIGRLRILFNEKIGLFVFHGEGNEYFGIRVSPIDDLKSHFDFLVKESFNHKETAKIYGEFQKTDADDLANSIIWALNQKVDCPDEERFFYILASKFSLFERHKELKKVIINLARKGKCKIRIILSVNSQNPGKYKKSLYEILTKELQKFENVKFYILDKNYSLLIGRNRKIVTNSLAMDVLDFGGKDYCCSKITNKEHITLFKEDIENIFLNIEQEKEILQS
jgi:hypothetical protein